MNLSGEGNSTVEHYLIDFNKLIKCKRPDCIKTNRQNINWYCIDKIVHVPDTVNRSRLQRCYRIRLYLFLINRSGMTLLINSICTFFELQNTQHAVTMVVMATACCVAQPSTKPNSVQVLEVGHVADSEVWAFRKRRALEKVKWILKKSRFVEIFNCWTLTMHFQRKIRN